MVRVITPGNDKYADTLGGVWWSGTSITCPRCGCVFRLDATDFEVQGPFVGNDLGQHLHWDMLDHNLNVITAGSSSIWWPSAVQGSCPWCNYYTILAKEPDFANPIHPADGSGYNGTVAGTIQSYVTAGATQVYFYKTNSGLVVGVFAKADGTVYGLDASATSAPSVRRANDGTIDVASTFNFGTPAFRMTPAAVQGYDSALYTYLTGFGLTIT